MLSSLPQPDSTDAAASFYAKLVSLNGESEVPRWSASSDGLGFAASSHVLTTETQSSCQRLPPQSLSFKSAGAYHFDLGGAQPHASDQAVQGASSTVGPAVQAEAVPSLLPSVSIQPAQQCVTQAPARQRLTWLQRYQQEQAELQQHRPPGTYHQPARHIAADNVGYRLLKKAGWQEGAGLGASEQGRKAPVPAWLQQGNRGIGFDGRHKAVQQPMSAQKQAEREAKAAAHLAQQATGLARKEMLNKMVEDELSSETVETKVKRHRQVMKQEADDMKRKAIYKHLSRALDDPFDVPYSTGDSNPLTRKHRLTSLNPLLDSDDDR
mmetsp:Transcript_37628/g.83774  ORF Transcript_37628/g.83774 Transcript_37628/m.83774 type:complete len:324 (-) Transcript_37628:153-1124(-)|eukprot:CAMPEP_0202904358 /NCGR_PEP_ID=MMETSP1392-20130828/29022_1 /ASSEMBLY_ACC=CAM_ASM_000868 /TAXON_ID=225041 /ORGANISM="Chlamydomonas chlamydogama, Strain SAG 11-48b" /LENGTH=323 /DNA_ID=CAMNT_0049591935 /DNA_START=88 /DNA_END=1059 /DNA_ORIENTATION=+